MAWSGLDDTSHNINTVFIIDDSDGVDTVGYSVALSGSLDSPFTDATDYVSYTVDVCNHFFSLPLEYTPVIESNVDEIPAADLHGKVTEREFYF